MLKTIHKEKSKLFMEIKKDEIVMIKLDINESYDNLSKRIYAFLDEEGGYTDYNQKIEDVAEEFGMSKESAESYVWNWASGLYKLEDPDYEEDVYEDAKNIDESLTENKTGKNAVWLDFRLEPEMKGQLKCADCEQTLNGRNCKSSLVHAVSAKWDRYDGMEWRCFCTRCYNGLKDEDPDEILDEFEPSTNYKY